MGKVQVLEEEVRQLRKDFDTIIELLAKDLPKDEIRKILRPTLTSKYRDFIISNVVERMGLAYFIDAVVKKVRAQRSCLDASVAQEVAYVKIFELGGRDRELKIESGYRVVMPSDLLNTALKRQNKNEYTELTFFPYDQVLKSNRGGIKYIALYESPLPNIHREGRSVYEEGKETKTKQRFGLPKAIAKDIFRIGDRVVFVGMYDNIAVFPYRDYSQHKRFIRDTSSLICLLNEGWSYSDKNIGRSK